MLCGLGKETIARGVDQEATWAAALARGGDDGKAVAACHPGRRAAGFRRVPRGSDGPGRPWPSSSRAARPSHLRAFVEKAAGRK